eukprot:6194556-Pleurochrysis_carterae.AAC.6
MDYACRGSANMAIIHCNVLSKNIQLYPISNPCEEIVRSLARGGKLGCNMPSVLSSRTPFVLGY